MKEGVDKLAPSAFTSPKQPLGAKSRDETFINYLMLESLVFSHAT